MFLVLGSLLFCGTFLLTCIISSCWCLLDRSNLWLGCYDCITCCKFLGGFGGKVWGFIVALVGWCKLRATLFISSRRRTSTIHALQSAFGEVGDWVRLWGLLIRSATINTLQCLLRQRCQVVFRSGALLFAMATFEGTNCLTGECCYIITLVSVRGAGRLLRLTIDWLKCCPCKWADVIATLWRTGWFGATWSTKGFKRILCQALQGIVSSGAGTIRVAASAASSKRLKGGLGEVGCAAALWRSGANLGWCLDGSLGPGASDFGVPAGAVVNIGWRVTRHSWRNTTDLLLKFRTSTGNFDAFKSILRQIHHRRISIYNKWCGGLTYCGSCGWYSACWTSDCTRSRWYIDHLRCWGRCRRWCHDRNWGGSGCWLRWHLDNYWLWCGCWRRLHNSHGDWLWLGRFHRHWW